MLKFNIIMLTTTPLSLPLYYFQSIFSG